MTSRFHIPGMVTTIGEVLPEAARRFGDKTSVIVEGAELSLARGMSSRSIRRHAAVAMKAIREEVKRGHLAL